MGNSGLIRELFNLTTGVWSLVALFGVYLVWRWPEIKRSYNEADAGKGTRRESLLDRLERRVIHLETRDEQCQHDLAEAIKRIAQLEGYQFGHGQAMQEAQIALSADRYEQSETSKKGKSHDPA